MSLPAYAKSYLLKSPILCLLVFLRLSFHRLCFLTILEQNKNNDVSLLFTQNFEDVSSIKNHYAYVHRINSNNYFLKKLFEKNGSFCIKKCCRCDEILLNASHDKKHHFLNHYQQGGSSPIASKPVNKTILDRKLLKFAINFD